VDAAVRQLIFLRVPADHVAVEAAAAFVSSSRRTR
jgi:hypothetical protein